MAQSSKNKRKRKKISEPLEVEVEVEKKIEPEEFISKRPEVFLDSHFRGNDVIPAKAGIHFAEKLVDDYLVVQPVASTPLETLPVCVKKEESKEKEAIMIVKKYAAIVSSTALIPIPALDIVAVSVILLKMLKSLSDLYGISFSSQRGKSAITAIVGGVHAGLFCKSLLKMVPFWGYGISVPSIVTLNFGLTYAIGKVFIQHFESGGTFLDFDPKTVKNFFINKNNV
ncbi:MAG: DUF697 domain-containing protein [Desulfobacterales bacterium]|nr:DUF697 domain-containing protein [Desulfobacterales bacterium]